MEAIEKAIEQNNLPIAAELCEALLKENEYDLIGLYFKAIVNRKMENYQEAIENHNTLINLLPDNPEYFAERGLTYHKLEARKEALEDFNRAVDLDPANAYRYSSRAFIKDFYGDHQGAVEDYHMAIELDPEDAIALNNLGVIEEKLGRMEKARENFDRSDKITGLDTKLQDLAAETNSQAAEVDDNLEPKNSGWRNFLKTFSSLFTSSKERQSFIRFVLRRK